jgi:hypothetical protein
MELFTRNILARTAAERWRRQYPDDKARHPKLKALGENPLPDDVDRIIGNKSWTEVAQCNECKRESLPAVVRLGDKPDYDSSTAWVCIDCLRKAVALAETVEVAEVE